MPSAEDNTWYLLCYRRQTKYCEVEAYEICLHILYAVFLHFTQGLEIPGENFTNKLTTRQHLKFWLFLSRVRHRFCFFLSLLFSLSFPFLSLFLLLSFFSSTPFLPLPSLSLPSLPSFHPCFHLSLSPFIQVMLLCHHIMRNYVRSFKI